MGILSSHLATLTGKVLPGEADNVSSGYHNIFLAKNIPKQYRTTNIINPFYENWLRIVELPLHQEAQIRPTITDKMAGESDRNGI